MLRRIRSFLIDDKLLVLGICLSLFCFFPILISQHLLDKDAALVIGPLSEVYGIGDYFDIFLTKKLLDIQPIRDFFLLIDIFVGRVIGHQFFGFSNWLIWILTCFYARKVARYYGNKEAIDFFFLLLVCHPMMIWVISWPLAKKHLLSSLFCLLAFYFSVKFKHKKTNNTFIIFICFFLSLLSQPISIFFPFVATIYLWKDLRKREVYILALFLFATSVIFGVLNWIYYSKLFTLYLGTRVVQPELLVGLSQRLFAFSRGFTQIFIPFEYASEYSATSFLGLIGLPLFVSLFVFKKINKKTTFFFSLLITYPLISANVRISSVFLSDTYLITSLIGIFLLICYKKLALKRWHKLIILVTLSLFCAKSVYEARIVIDDRKYLETSYQRDPNCKSLISLTAYYLREVEIENFYKLSSVALKSKCFINGLFPQLMINNLYAFRVYLDKENTIEEKLNTLKKSKIITPDIGYLEVLLMWQIQDFEKANKLFETLPDNHFQFLKALNHLRKTDCLTCPRI